MLAAIINQCVQDSGYISLSPEVYKVFRKIAVFLSKRSHSIQKACLKYYNRKYFEWGFVMNILFYLTPKCDCAYIETSDTLRQAMEKMEYHKYSSIPILDDEGSYVGVLTEGDLLWGIKNKYDLDLKEAENVPITDINRRRDYAQVSVRSSMEDLIKVAMNQNFVPVMDDDGKFIGIVTRKDIIKYFSEKIEEAVKADTEYQLA